ncbi:MAG: ATP-binding protein [Verrucomicrobiota bacterium]|jgi:signal transduction histidine kinase
MFEELSQHVLDIAMNSLSANAKKVQISILESRKRDCLILRVRDDGHGMDAATLKQVLTRRWSSKKKRRKPVGLGLALLQQTAEMCDGHFHVRSVPGRGTSVTASMRLSHIDRPPLGDLNTTILALCATDKKMDVQLNYRSDEQKFSFDSRELATRGGVIL